MSVNSRLGRYEKSTVAGEVVKAFVPPLLPPIPPVQMSEQLLDLVEKANRALGRLDAVREILPDTRLFLYMYTRKEALLSSQIEGTQSSFQDLLLFEHKETPGVPLMDVEEVSCYVRAMDHGLLRLREGFPLCVRLFKEIHAVLLDGARGGDKSPGEFRRSQNWIGGSRPGNATFVPPPHTQLQDLMGNLEDFLHDKGARSPVLIKAALAHVQFETIHPFLDGNGRLGRLLITFLLCVEGALEEPLLYLSLFFKENRKEYYAALQRVRTHGDWEAWLAFFLRGVQETAKRAVDTARAVVQLFERDRRRLQEKGREGLYPLQILDRLQRDPFVDGAAVAATLQTTTPTARKVIAKMVELGILREYTGKQRYRKYMYSEYIDLLAEGTEPLR